MRLPFLFDPFDGGDWEDWLHDRRDWLAGHGARIVVVVLLLLLANFLFHRVVGRVLLNAITRAARARKEDAQAIRRRADTLSATLNWGFGIFLVFLGAGLLLAETGMNVSALIASVGIVGIALGLGAQTLVRDVLNGLFILIEDQYRVGDQVSVAGASGEVVEINPRRTVIRDADGNVHSIPNSAISVAVNRTPGLNRVRVDLEVPFRDADQAARLASEVCAEVAKEQLAAVASPPKLAAQKAAGDGDAILQIAGDALSGHRWELESELRKRLKRRFDAEGMELRFASGEPAERAK